MDVLSQPRDFKLLGPYLTVVGLQEVEESRLTDKKGALEHAKRGKVRQWSKKDSTHAVIKIRLYRLTSNVEASRQVRTRSQSPSKCDLRTIFGHLTVGRLTFDTIFSHSAIFALPHFKYFQT